MSVIPGWAALPDRPIGGGFSLFASLSTASPGFTSKHHISKLINKSVGEGKRKLLESFQQKHRKRRRTARLTQAHVITES